MKTKPRYEMELSHDELSLLVAVLTGVITTGMFNDSDWLPRIKALVKNFEGWLAEGMASMKGEN